MLAGMRQGQWYQSKVSKTGCKTIITTEWVKYFDRDQPVLCWIKKEDNYETKKGYPSPQDGYEKRNTEAAAKQKSFLR